MANEKKARPGLSKENYAWCENEQIAVPKKALVKPDAFFEDDDNQAPRCPHCKQPVTEL